MKKELTHIALLTSLLLLSGSVSLWAQDRAEAPESPLMAGWGRWSAKLNVVDLGLAVPNLGIEFDLGKDKYSKNSLSLTARYNWNEWHSYQPYVVWNVSELRPEYRHYCRGLKRTKGVFYWGIYGSAGKYSCKFTETGHQGMMCGGGLSFGTALPLHEYRKFAIDLELGGSVGACLCTSQAYQRSSDGMTYMMLPDQVRGLEILPFPVVSELRVAFVFRKVSVKSRYQLTQDQTTVLRKKARDRAYRKQEKGNDKKDE